MPVTRKGLAGAGVYQTYKIKKLPEEVLNALNMEGEVILKGQYNKRPVYLEILATSDGLEVTVFDC